MMPDLGKYADTVLSAYAASLIIIVVLVVLSLRTSRKVLRELTEIEERRRGKD